jgi:hypothetical protein
MGRKRRAKLRAMSVEAPIILFIMYADALQSEDTSAAAISAVISKTDLLSLQQHIEKLPVAT